MERKQWHQKRSAFWDASLDHASITTFSVVMGPRDLDNDVPHDFLMRTFDSDITPSYASIKEQKYPLTLSKSDFVFLHHDPSNTLKPHYEP